jgi:hypothetical protein
MASSIRRLLSCAAAILPGGAMHVDLECDGRVEVADPIAEDLGLDAEVER